MIAIIIIILYFHNIIMNCNKVLNLQIQNQPMSKTLWFYVIYLKSCFQCKDISKANNFKSTGKLYLKNKRIEKKSISQKYVYPIFPLNRVCLFFLS